MSDFQNATWLVVAASDYSSVLGTSFAVTPHLLATNAHVVQGILGVLAEPNGVAGVIQHETGTKYILTEVWSHRDYSSTTVPSSDVGLLKVDDTLPSHVSVAEDNILRELSVFETVRLCGFPGSITEGIDAQGIFSTGQFHPRVSCLSGNISAIRPFDAGASATPANTFLIQHDISTEPGVSGSAVFDESGNLIGVHALGYSEESEQNFAIRADVLGELLELVENEGLGGTILANIPQTDPGGSLCTPICTSTELCDSDCDGWYDAVEVENGGDPCDPFDPPFSPEPGTQAGICDDIGAGGDTTIGCQTICNFGYCDSDCDGWFDEVELAFDTDPCNPFNPPVAPSSPATICFDLGILKTFGTEVLGASGLSIQQQKQLFDRKQNGGR